VVVVDPVVGVEFEGLGGQLLLVKGGVRVPSVPVAG
jgi:hypothetical protein